MRALRPLRHREFRLLWSGLAVSLVGDGVWLVALAWQVIELGGGPLQLSFVTTSFAVGLIGCILVGGVVADRVSRRRVMLAADALRLVVTLTVGALAVAGTLGVGSAPVMLFGVLEVLWAMVAVALFTGFCDQLGQVVWGTLLQRRVPAELQGRVASLDWFVSLGLTPVSMALAGPAAELAGVTAVFVVSGIVCATAGLGVLFGLGLRRDELEHPLDAPATSA